MGRGDSAREDPHWYLVSVSLFFCYFAAKFIQLKINDKLTLKSQRLPKMSDGPEYIGVHIATKLMTEYLDEHKNDFNDYKVIISNKTSTCKPDYVLKNYIKFFENRADLIGVLGPCKLITSLA